MTYGALVIGGGPAGSSAAYFLSRKGWPVALLERRVFPRRKVCGEYLSASNWALLRALKIDDRFLDSAGPEVTRVGLYSGTTALSAPLPASPNGWGRALGRDTLDELLIKRAMESGVNVLQPWAAQELERRNGEWICRARSEADGQEKELRARIVIAANGSWDPSDPTKPGARIPQRPGDLFGFKAHFSGGGLPAGLMPLLAFPGGYGGLVNTYRNLLSLSCCIRRDFLARLNRSGGISAGDAVLGHILETCPAASPALKYARREGEFLAAGPIRPGFRRLYESEVFRVGNAAGEAHPVVAEGISMALQSGWLLASVMPDFEKSKDAYTDAGRAYTKRWRQLFAPRIRAAALFAHLAMRPFCARAATSLLKRLPSVLTLCAEWSGKIRAPESVFSGTLSEASALQ